LQKKYFDMDREELLKRLEKVKKRKQECVDWMVKEASEDYKKKFGETPSYIEVW